MVILVSLFLDVFLLPSLLELPRSRYFGVSSRSFMFAKLATWWGGPSPDPKPAPLNPLNPQGIKPCCACPDTKRARDECYMQSDPDIANEKCKDLVAAHVKCMRGYGFEV